MFVIVVIKVFFLKSFFKLVRKRFNENMSRGFLVFREGYLDDVNI